MMLHLIFRYPQKRISLSSKILKEKKKKKIEEENKKKEEIKIH